MADKNMKDEIIRSLLDTSFSRSLGATSLADIATNLSIKKASLYNHFNSRDDLVSQTIKACEEYINEITFIPANVDAITKKYPAGTVLKGLVTRYFKMHEKEPLFQIYTFIQEQKYFNAEVAKVVREEKEKLLKQTSLVMESLIVAGKLSIKKQQVSSASLWFISGMNDMLNMYLLDRKEIVMKNPESGEGELFSIPAGDGAMAEIEKFVDSFVGLINGIES